MIFALDHNLEKAAEILVLHSSQESKSLVVHFHKWVLLWQLTGTVPKKVYAAIRLVLEITSLNCLIWKTNLK